MAIEDVFVVLDVWTGVVVAAIDDVTSIGVFDVEIFVGGCVVVNIFLIWL